MAAELINNTKAIDNPALSEALMLGIVRQHQAAEVAELLIAELRNEIAQRKKAEDALIKTEKLASVGRMAAVLAHEINNPLEAVTNILFLAQTTEGLPEAARKYLTLAETELRRIAHITRQTLGFYRESSAPINIQVATLLTSVCDLLHAKTISKHAVIEKQCDHNLQLFAFEGEMRQVLSNLLLNSLEALAEGGKIVLRASSFTNAESGLHSIRIAVADNGEGISDDAMDQIFDPFFTTKGSVGNGLGLWVCKQIVEKHGGTIRVRSRTEGRMQGTTFWLILPVGTHSIEKSDGHVGL